MRDLEDFYNDYWDFRKASGYLSTNNTPERIFSANNIIEKHEPRNILDVGCGEGQLGNILPDYIKKIGIDISTEALEIADEHYDETYCLNIESDSLFEVFENREFECIICLETLEHLFYPDMALQNMADLIEEDGLLITSFPNSVYWKHRLDMLFGRKLRSYTIYNDAEHIQDFTLNSFKSLLENAGFEPQLEVPHTYQSIPRWLIELRPSLLASQIVIAAKSKN